MGKNRSETLVIEFYRYVGNSSAPTIDKLLHACQVFAWLPIRLSGLTYHDSLHRFFLYIGLQKVEKF